MLSCASCPSTDVRKFGEDHYCKECVGDGVPVCEECGTTGDHDMACINVGDVSFCGSCRSVESYITLEWEDGEVIHCEECNGTDGKHFLNCSVWKK